MARTHDVGERAMRRGEGRRYEEEREEKRWLDNLEAGREGACQSQRSCEGSGGEGEDSRGLRARERGRGKEGGTHGDERRTSAGSAMTS